MGVSDHKCIACNAQLKFNPESQKWVCEYCGTEYLLKDLEDDRGNKINVNVSSNNVYKEYHCPDCGAQIVMDENTASTECVYCGNTAIITERFEGEFEPSRVIPFKKTKEEAFSAFYNYKKGKFFMPKDFIRKENIDKVTGVYIPFFLYDMRVYGGLNVEATNEQRWSDSKYNYIKKEFYKVVREGTMEFNKIPTDASKKFCDDIMDSIEPYNYNGLTSFNSSYMSGFLADIYDLDSNELLSRAEQRAKETTRQILYSDITGYSSKRIKSSVENVKLQGNPEYVLLPVWMLNVKYENKCYTLAMNGQTGKFIGNVPISKTKVIKTWIGTFMILTTILTVLGMIL